MLVCTRVSVHVEGGNKVADLLVTCDFLLLGTSLYISLKYIA